MSAYLKKETCYFVEVNRVKKERKEKKICRAAQIVYKRS